MCQVYTQNFYIAQHFKIKGNYAVKSRLTPYNIALKAVICRHQETG
ncbi:hypothetical protein HMPREF9086_4398 [Enterobacter hormaechei ATCC 49162]|nr:hypothetical protein HMPREF9086_4398 [Enterobacter hormaechei ATCC 49162]